MSDWFPTQFGGTSSELLLWATQTVGLVAYARQHMSRINGVWVFPMCVVVAFVVCFPSASNVDLQFAQRAIAVSMLAFGAMVLRRGGNGAPTPSTPPDDGRPSAPPPVRPSSHSDSTPMTSVFMHVVPLLLLGMLCMPMIARLVR